ncbi:glutathione S-transferase [Xylariaceae sp. FL0804]|nr:glutathione S-transferase [Xylariaceae sp. FL0804]
MAARVRQVAGHVSPSTTTQSALHLYTAASPNGIKVSILLEELELPYQVTEIDIENHVQKEPWFLDINPNGRIPALTDTRSDGEPIKIFESGAIMQYLCERYDGEHKVSYPRGNRKHDEVNSWLHWQMAGLGPMLGRVPPTGFAPVKIEYAISRYRNECRRLYQILDKQLQSSAPGYLVGEHCTIADIACWPWIAASRWCGIDRSEFAALNAWVARMLARPGVERGRHVPSRHVHLILEEWPEEKLERRAEAFRRWFLENSNKDVQK